MKIFAIRDRLIDYYMTPFAADNDKAVMASLARMINDPETTDAIASAPHHYELWELGHVTEDGTLVAERTLLCDASSLIRAGIRTRAERGDAEGGLPDQTGRRAADGARSDAQAAKPAPELEMDSETRTFTPPRRAAPGVPRDS